MLNLASRDDRQVLRWMALLGVALLGGCSCSGKPTPIGKPVEAPSAQTAAQALTQTVQEAAGQASGSVELVVNGPLKIDRCFARFTPAGGDRPGVLQLMTYEQLNPNHREEGLPSVLLWAELAADQPSSLVGKTVLGHLFVQGNTSSVLYASPPTKPIEIKIAAVSAWSVTCEVRDAELTQADGDKPTPATGKLVGLWK